MNKKSFIRGFGTGVLFATIILGISCLVRTSDSSVIKKAKELGMDFVTKEESLFPATEATTKSALKEKEQQKANKQNKEVESPTPSPAKKEEVKDKTTNTKDEFKNEKEKIEKELDEISRELTIKEGEWSSDVSRNLEELGVISDAAEFDNYLEEHGYSDEIRAGTFEIPIDAEFEEIAEKITS